MTDTELRCYICGASAARNELGLMQSPDDAEARELVCVWCVEDDDAD